MMTFSCLQTRDVVTANISDHHPIVHHGVLFWNIMMQGRERRDKSGHMSYNNGLGIIENDEQYTSRLIKIAQIIAEIVSRNPNVEIIGLCEGPIQSHHISVFIRSLKTGSCLKRFIRHDTLYSQDRDGQPHWGLFMLADQKYKINSINEITWGSSKHLLPLLLNKLANRFQLWKLVTHNNELYFALAHFPFGEDECITEKTMLSPCGNRYCDLINHVIHQYADKSLIFCADFNFNPYLIHQWEDRALDKIPSNNSVLLWNGENHGKLITKKITVDGILLSAKEKIKYYTTQYNPGLFARLRYEHHLLQSITHEEPDTNKLYPESEETVPRQIKC